MGDARDVEGETETEPDRVRVAQDGTIQVRKAGSRSWTTTSLRRLARDYAADHPVWERLRKDGYRRPSPSGPTVPENRRKRVHCSLRWYPHDIARLDALAATWGVTRSEAALRLLASHVPDP